MECSCLNRVNLTVAEVQFCQMSQMGEGIGFDHTDGVMAQTENHQTERLRKCMTWNCGQFIVTQINVNQVEQIRKGSCVDLGNVVVAHINLLKIEQLRTGEHVLSHH